jgi:hypothetical protein
MILYANNNEQQHDDNDDADVAADKEDDKCQCHKKHDNQSLQWRQGQQSPRMTATMLQLPQTGRTTSVAAVKPFKQQSTFQASGKSGRWGDNTTVYGKQWMTDDGQQTIDNG